MYHLLSLLCFLPASLIAQSILQSPPALITYRGEEVHLGCQVQGAGEPYMYWYRKTPTTAVTHISSSAGKSSVEEMMLSHFTAERNNQTDFTLKTKNIQIDDGGIYYCAWSHTAAEGKPGA
ncbi:hypothetical protein GDO78_014533, partial [Eleutherodactylus coqui]